MTDDDESSTSEIVWITTPDNYSPETQEKLRELGSRRVDILRSQGFTVRMAHSSDVVPGHAGGRPRLWHQGGDLLEHDAGFIVSSWTWDARIVEHLSAITRTVKASDRPLLTDRLRDPERLGNDKLAMYHHAGALGIPVLPSVVVPYGRYAKRALEIVSREIKGETYLVKPRSLAMGIGVLKADGLQQLGATIDVIAASGLGCIIQPCLPGASDVRVYVYRGEVIAALHRQPQEGHYLSNLSQGGQASLADLDPDIAAMSIQLTRSLDADYLCVDWLVSEQAPVFNEWMTISAGFEDLPEPYMSRVADALAHHIRQQLASASAGLPT